MLFTFFGPFTLARSFESALLVGTFVAQAAEISASEDGTALLDIDCEPLLELELELELPFDFELMADLERLLELVAVEDFEPPLVLELTAELLPPPFVDDEDFEPSLELVAEEVFEDPLEELALELEPPLVLELTAELLPPPLVADEDFEPSFVLELTAEPLPPPLVDDEDFEPSLVLELEDPFEELALGLEPSFEPEAEEDPLADDLAEDLLLIKTGR